MTPYAILLKTLIIVMVIVWGLVYLKAITPSSTTIQENTGFVLFFWILFLVLITVTDLVIAIRWKP